jgi:hypothetical protein
MMGMDIRESGTILQVENALQASQIDASLADVIGPDWKNSTTSDWLKRHRVEADIRSTG